LFYPLNLLYWWVV